MFAVAITDQSYLAQAKKLAQKLNLPLVTKSVEHFQKFLYLLVVSPNGLELHNNHLQKPIKVDFFDPSLQYRVRAGGGKQQLLAKAIGLKKYKNLTLVDATAGFGIDSFIIATLGGKVMMVERSPIVHALLEDGLTRLYQKVAHLKLQLAPNSIEAIAYFSQLQIKPDVIYLDPMYPARKKTALNKYKMRVLHKIVGDDLDAPELLRIALEHAQKRIVVKRPKYAPHLDQLKPDIQFLSEGNSRYDIYLKH